MKPVEMLWAHAYFMIGKYEAAHANVHALPTKSSTAAALQHPLLRSCESKYQDVINFMLCTSVTSFPDLKTRKDIHRVKAQVGKTLCGVCRLLLLDMCML